MKHTAILLLQITSYGWAAIAMMVLSVLVAVKMLRRNNSQRRPGCLGVGYIALIVFLLLGFATMLSGMLGGFVYHAFKLPRYEARVVDHFAYEDKNSKGNRVTMYRPVVVFTDAGGQEQRLQTDIASSGAKEIGSTITVLYEPGMSAAEELSGGKYVLLGGAFMGLLIIAFLLVAGITYAMGRPMARISMIGMGLLVYVVFPAGMLFLLGGMGYAVVLYFMGKKPDMPIWALAICIFFCIVLLLAFMGYVRMLFEKPRRMGTRGWQVRSVRHKTNKRKLR